MGISFVNLSLMASSGAYNMKATAKTKAALEELGIIYNANITEKEAQDLLKKANMQNLKQDKQSLSDGNSQKDSLFKKAHELAKHLGVKVDEKIPFEQLLSLIEATLETKIKANSNNIEVLKQLKEYSQDLASIQAQSKGSSGYDNSNQVLMQSLEMLSLYNKNYLNK